MSQGGLIRFGEPYVAAEARSLGTIKIPEFHFEVTVEVCDRREDYHVVHYSENHPELVGYKAECQANMRHPSIFGGAKAIHIRKAQ